MVKNNKGAALVMTVAVVIMLLFLAAASAQLLSGYYTHYSRMISRAKAYYAVEAGVAQAYSRLFAGETGNFTVSIPWRLDKAGSVIDSRTVTITVTETPAGSGVYAVSSTCPITR